MLSFGSHRSTGSVGKIDLHETPKDKMSRKMQTKADPTKAMTEAQPGRLHCMAEDYSTNNV